MAANKSYNIYCLLAFFALLLPLLIGFTKADSRPNLTGIVITEDKPEFSWGDWYAGIYQSEMESYNEDHWAFKEKMVRLNNQFYYNAFNQIRVNNFVSGKNDYVFAEGYIHSAYGDDLIEEDKIIAQLKKAKVVQDSLKKRGIDLIIGFAPGKGVMCDEFIDDKYKHPKHGTNHAKFLAHAQKLNLNILDLYTYFLEQKPKAQYPLFTKFGHHWSNYGECLAVQQCIKYIENLRGTDLPDLLWDTVEVVDTARSRDADVLNSMNLLTNPKQNMKLAYPMLRWENDSIKNSTRVLVIGDSYWYGAVYMGVGQRAFGYGDFWYYYNRVVPQRVAGEKLEVWELDLKSEIESHNVIMLMYADGNLRTYGSSFIEDAYELYTSPSTFNAKRAEKQLIQSYAKQIRDIPALLKKSTKKSGDLLISLDSAITLDARKMAGLDYNQR